MLTACKVGSITWVLISFLISLEYSSSSSSVILSFLYPDPRSGIWIYKFRFIALWSFSCVPISFVITVIIAFLSNLCYNFYSLKGNLTYFVLHGLAMYSSFLYSSDILRLNLVIRVFSYFTSFICQVCFCGPFSGI